MLPYRVILVDTDADRTTTIVAPLERAPDPGSIIDLPHGGRLIVRHVVTSSEAGLAGTILGRPV